MTLRGLIEAVAFDLRDGATCSKGRSFADTYDTMMEVQRNPTGAFMAIEQMDAVMDKARRDLSAILRALAADQRERGE